MSIKALIIPVFFFIALSATAFAQVTGGSTAGTTPGTTETIPGTTGTIPGTTETIPGTTGTIPGTTGTIPGTTPMPPATTPLPSPTTQPPFPPTSNIPDFSQDNTNITGRFDGSGESGSIFDTLDSGIFEDDPETPMDDTVLE